MSKTMPGRKPRRAAALLVRWMLSPLPVSRKSGLCLPLGEGVLPAATSSFPTGKGASAALGVGSARWWLLLPAPVLGHVVVPRNTEERKDRHVEWQGFPALKSQWDTLLSCGPVCASSLRAHP